MGFGKSKEELTGVAQYLSHGTVRVPTWQYALVQFPTFTSLEVISNQLDLMGSYGWEMCERRDVGTGVMRNSDGFFTFVFKRQTG